MDYLPLFLTEIRHDVLMADCVAKKIRKLDVCKPGTGRGWLVPFPFVKFVTITPII
jgi:hypothetical protein